MCIARIHACGRTSLFFSLSLCCAKERTPTRCELSFHGCSLHENVVATSSANFSNSNSLEIMGAFHSRLRELSPVTGVTIVTDRRGAARRRTSRKFKLRFSVDDNPRDVFFLRKNYARGHRESIELDFFSIHPPHFPRVCYSLLARKIVLERNVNIPAHRSSFSWKRSWNRI